MNPGKTFPILPSKDTVVFPNTQVSFKAGKELAGAMKAAEGRSRKMIITGLKDPAGELDDPQNILETGTLCRIMQVLETEPGNYRIFVEGLKRVRIISPERNAKNDFAEAECEALPTTGRNDPALIPAKKLLANTMQNYFDVTGVPDDIAEALMSIDETEKFINYSASLAKQSNIKEFQELLETDNIVERAQKLIMIIKGELNVIKLESNIEAKVKERFEKSQKEAFIQEHIKALRDEMGKNSGSEEDGDEEEEDIFDLSSFEAPQHVISRLKNEITKAKRTAPFTPEKEIITNYIETLRALPWSKSTECEIDIKKAKTQLDADHYGLEEIKERILEYLAVLKLVGNLKAPIICLAGPPGVGKTSIASSLAKATGRKFIRQSLGGIKDEAEIRGHRRTYVAAMPGKIIQSLQKVGVNNPLFLLDEIDKLGNDYKGDPASALLEVLDPEQNSTFLDHFLDLEFDLSNILFIATANDKNSIPPALKDRMEIIDIEGYTPFEKKNIAVKHLIPKQKELNGIADLKLDFTEKGLDELIRSYTCEAGVRELERKIASICRKIALAIANGEGKKSVTVTENNLEEYLGVKKYSPENIEKTPKVGVVNGLAWTPFGGEVLQIEAIKYPGKGGTEVTGSLGDVMKESVRIAASYVRSLFSENKIVADTAWDKTILHIHFPSGATPKDGPSAGGAISLAIASLMSGIPVRPFVAMTGEVTLRGHILKIGGLKAKVMAAKEAGIKELFIPAENEGDYNEIPAEIREGIKVKFVRECSEILFDCLPGLKKKRSAD